MLALVMVPPAAAAVLIALRLVRGELAIARCACAGSLLALLTAIAGLATGGDRLGGSVAVAAAGIALVVAAYAARALGGSSVDFARFFGAFSAATAASLTVAVAADLRVLAAAWIATGLGTTALLACAGHPAAWRWARRQAAIELAGDAAWCVVLVLAGRTYGTYGLGALAHAVRPGSEATAIALALVVAGAARSALVPFHDWLPNSMEAPTPVSAFMHAGLVNGAGVLLAKTAFVVALAPAALVLAALLGFATALTGATIALVRPESKRRLGWSTVAQMGFMVLQCGCGAFGAAVVHLIAHGAYKSTAFLGVAGSIDAHKLARRAGASAPLLRAPQAAALSYAAATLGVALAFALLRERLVALPAAPMVVALTWAAACSAARAGTRYAADAPAVAAIFTGVAGSVTAYLLAVAGLDAFVGASLPHLTVAAPTAVVAVLAIGAGVLAGAGVRFARTDRVYTLAVTEGRAVPFAAR